MGQQWHQLDHTQIITPPAPRQSIFTGRMLFLTLNQQCQNTEAMWVIQQCKNLPGTNYHQTGLDRNSSQHSASRSRAAASCCRWQRAEEDSERHRAASDCVVEREKECLTCDVSGPRDSDHGYSVTIATATTTIRCQCSNHLPSRQI